MNSVITNINSRFWNHWFFSTHYVFNDVCFFGLPGVVLTGSFPANCSRLCWFFFGTRNCSLCLLYSNQPLTLQKLTRWVIIFRHELFLICISTRYKEMNMSFRTTPPMVSLYSLTMSEYATLQSSFFFESPSPLGAAGFHRRKWRIENNSFIIKAFYDTQRWI